MWYREGVIARRKGLGTILSPKKQVVLVTREGIFVPPAEVLKLNGEGTYIVLYDALPEGVGLLAREVGEKDVAAYIYEGLQKIDDGYVFVGGRKRVFPFSVPQIALCSALGYGADYLYYVLTSVRESVVVFGG